MLTIRGNGGDKFYDDNEWVGLAKLQLYLTSGDKAALERAKAIFKLVVSGWDTDASHPAPGGHAGRHRHNQALGRALRDTEPHCRGA